MCTAERKRAGDGDRLSSLSDAKPRTSTTSSSCGDLSSACASSGLLSSGDARAAGLLRLLLLSLQHDDTETRNSSMYRDVSALNNHSLCTNRFSSVVDG